MAGSDAMSFQVFLRLFFVQALWNYRSMLGAGLAWAMLPALREIHGDDEEAFRDAVRRAAEHFNAHPYLTGLAAGALLRMERAGEDPELSARFRRVLRAPLGSLGDRLIWSSWLPACILAAVSVGLLLQAPLLAVVLFLLAYNALHLPLRWWSLQTGLTLGRKLGDALRRADLPTRAERVGRGGVFLLGLLAGLALASGVGTPDPVLSPRGALLVAALGILVFIFGWIRGRTPGWWTPVIVMSTVIGLLALGAAT